MKPIRLTAALLVLAGPLLRFIRRKPALPTIEGSPWLSAQIEKSREDLKAQRNYR